jgi:very-short-patch-repair endonuclease
MDKSEEEETVASESESILDLCLNLYKPIRQLRWHYRSQHETLINFSNQQFYDGNLIVFPSPSAMNNDELGIKYHYIENSVFQNRINKVEAKVIIDHLEKQMTKYPDKSIGIGTFNSDQRDLIQGLLDEREKISPMVSNYISKWVNTSEPFFIKNLENLQGDERDVIFISTTYGKDKETGKIYQRFGPINTDTGWRRLNVMFTRSKQKMEIFTSLNSSDIILSENSSRGVRALKSFLNYLETGVMKKAPGITDKGFDSEFEESVYEILDNYGYKVIPQVGVAGYFIDLSVVSEKNPNDFVLAIECDGATYHSSKSARDRDRLKQEVLEKLGWTVYRIWSVDWYKNRENEISKLIQAVKEAQLNYKGKVQEEPEYQEIQVEEVKQIDKDIDKEIKKDTSDDKKNTKNQYSQIFLSDEKVKEMLIELRDSKIATEFEIDRR